MNKGKILNIFKSAFPHTIPIFRLTLGLTYGIYMNVSGFSFWYPMIIDITYFCRLMKDITVNMLLGLTQFKLLQWLLMINARHLFYGIAIANKYKGTGWKKIYLIFRM